MSTSTTVQTNSSNVVEEPISLLQHELINSEFKISRSESNSRSFNFDLLKDHIPQSSIVSLDTPYSEALISKALNEEISKINYETCEPGAEDSFFVCDLGKIERLFKIWKQSLPRVHPFYAVKCNPNPEVLKLLAKLGANFDCASKGEIELILSLGIDPSRIIYAHPCKVGSFLRFAQKQNVGMTTFDNADELYKIKKFHPNCKLLLRIITDDESAQCRLSTKYGAPLSNVSNLLNLAKELGLNIAGVSFHVGSGASDNESLIKAVHDSRNVFNIGRSMGFNMNTLDVGGGFSYESFDHASKALSGALDKFFPVEYGVNIIAEPGRYFVANAFTLATHVIARRGGIFDQQQSDEPTMIYINDGVYGNMNCILFDHQQPEAHVLTNRDEFLFGELNQSSNDKFKVSIWGPTCDGLDCINKSTYLSHNVVVGDWLYFPNLGAYTSAAASPFNGFKADANTVYINSERYFV
ncbi:Ornithine decarboxylase [Wickerhamomyces ciferrii]|uniref:Ornithine decarboxylase n=1 Tax=Wickerhamomyces ciferrii (strain ATCC 14091 / BCRC 22168 / CBS 111 / JCM 3599 / NBRC 0793 / NRRL Y-1031 F-60-10) TaxID=1206466 RepID=K0KWB2_WICCF|nr:Ornithine decarboxylase [Wickerhamomyces ciferrii]CCH45764.1 Ornithine decarboxylase [Wickerhamomyces ciferrii]